MSLRKFAEAEPLYQRAIEGAEAPGSERVLGDALLGLGMAVRERDPAKAVELHRRAIEVSTSSHDDETLVTAWASLGVDHLRRDDPAAAAAALETAIRLSDERGAMKGSFGIAHRNLAKAYLALDRPRDAVAAARQGLSMRRARASELGETFGAQEQVGGRDTADLAMRAAARWAEKEPPSRADAVAAAFAITESVRATFLAERIGSDDADPAAESSVEAQDEKRARERLEVARKQLLLATFSGTAEPKALEALRTEYEAASDARRAVLGRLELRRRASVAAPVEPLPLAEVRGAVPEGVVLVDLHVAEERTFAVVVSRADARLVDLGPSRPTAETALRWRRELETPTTDEVEEGLAESLHRALLAPLEPFLPDGSTLLVARDSYLSFLPLEALLRVRDGRRTRAIEAWPIAYVPSASIWVRRIRAGEAPAGDRVVALGDPVYPGERATGARDADSVDRGLADLDRLPATAGEAESVAAFFPPERRVLLLRENATRERLLAAVDASAGRLRVLHVACHGFADDRLPGRSGLVIAGADVLTLDDVAQLRVRADLVVLSACESGHGKVRQGEGTRALPRAFLGAGARRVVAAERRVGDEDARALLRPFYEGLLRDGLSPIAALRAAKLSRLRAGGAAARPYAWASFVLWD